MLNAILSISHYHHARLGSVFLMLKLFLMSKINVNYQT